jgi:Fic family protein
LPPAALKNLQEWYRVETTYTSNALEGNTLTSSETAIVVEKGLTIGGKTVQEHLEAINHAHAFDYIVSLVNESRQNVTLRQIKNIHQLVLKDIDNTNAGGWRQIHIKISGSSYEFPPPWKLPELMEEFETWLTSSTEHPVIVAAEAHLRLVTIHPFVDGNGRTARLLMNLLLMQAGYPPAIIHPKVRVQYIESLVQAQQFGNIDPFLSLITTAVDESLDIYLLHAKTAP